VGSDLGDLVFTKLPDQFLEQAREVSARQVLYGTPMPVATATLDRHLADPFGPIWLPLRADRRVRLLDLRTWGSE
jgi:hypothetical protein